MNHIVWLKLRRTLVKDVQKVKYQMKIIQNVYVPRVNIEIAIAEVVKIVQKVHINLI